MIVDLSNYKQHFLTGLIATILISSILILLGYLPLTILNIIILLAISFIYSLLPDIDIGTSMIRKVFLLFFVGFIFINGLNMIGYILGLIVILIQFISHRGIMHSIIMGILLSGMLYFCFGSWTFPLIALVNFISHLILDRR